MSRDSKTELDAKLTVNLGSIHIHHHSPRPCHDEIVFDAGPEYFTSPLPKSSNRLEGFFVAYQLKDNKGLHLKLTGKSKHGNPVDFKNEEVQVASSDEAILSVKEDTGVITIEPVGPLGTAQVQVTIPGVVHDGVALSGTFDVQVIAGDAETLSMEPADTFDLDTPAPAPAPPAPAGP